MSRKDVTTTHVTPRKRSAGGQFKHSKGVLPTESENEEAESQEENPHRHQEKTPSSRANPRIKGEAARGRPASEHSSQRNVQGSHITSFSLFNEIAVGSFADHTFIQGCKRIRERTQQLISEESSNALITLIDQKIQQSLSTVAVRRIFVKNLTKQDEYRVDCLTERKALAASNDLDETKYAAADESREAIIASLLEKETSSNIYDIKTIRDAFLAIMNRSQHVSILGRKYSAEEHGRQGAAALKALNLLRQLESSLKGAPTGLGPENLKLLASILNLPHRRTDAKDIYKKIAETIAILFDVSAVCDGLKGANPLEKEAFVTKAIFRHLACCAIAFPFIKNISQVEPSSQEPPIAAASISEDEPATATSLAAADATSLSLDDYDHRFKYSQLNESQINFEEEDGGDIQPVPAPRFEEAEEEEEEGRHSSAAPAKVTASIFDEFKLVIINKVNEDTSLLEQEKGEIEGWINEARIEEDLSILEESHKYLEAPRSSDIERPEAQPARASEAAFSGGASMSS